MVGFIEHLAPLAQLVLPPGVSVHSSTELLKAYGNLCGAYYHHCDEEGEPDGERPLTLEALKKKGLHLRDMTLAGMPKGDVPSTVEERPLYETYLPLVAKAAQMWYRGCISGDILSRCDTALRRKVMTVGESPAERRQAAGAEMLRSRRSVSGHGAVCKMAALLGSFLLRLLLRQELHCEAFGEELKRACREGRGNADRTALAFVGKVMTPLLSLLFWVTENGEFLKRFIFGLAWKAGREAQLRHFSAIASDLGALLHLLRLSTCVYLQQMVEELEEIGVSEALTMMWTKGASHFHHLTEAIGVAWRFATKLAAPLPIQVEWDTKTIRFKAESLPKSVFMTLAPAIHAKLRGAIVPIFSSETSGGDDGGLRSMFVDYLCDLSIPVRLVGAEEDVSMRHCYGALQCTEVVDALCAAYQGQVEEYVELVWRVQTFVAVACTALGGAPPRREELFRLLRSKSIAGNGIGWIPGDHNACGAFQFTLEVKKQFTSRAQRPGGRHVQHRLDVVSSRFALVYTILRRAMTMLLSTQRPQFMREEQSADDLLFFETNVIPIDDAEAVAAAAAAAPVVEEGAYSSRTMRRFSVVCPGGGGATGSKELTVAINSRFTSLLGLGELINAQLTRVLLCNALDVLLDGNLEAMG